MSVTPIYPANKYDNQMTTSQLIVDNVVDRRETYYSSNNDGTGTLTPIPTMYNFITSLLTLYDDLYEAYALGAMPIGADSTITEKAPSVSNKWVDIFTNIKQIKLRRLQTRMKLITFELNRMGNELLELYYWTDQNHNLPYAADSVYPSSKRGPDPNGGW